MNSPNIQSGYFYSLISQSTHLLGNVLIFLISLAVVWFIWNVIRYAMGTEEDSKEKAKKQMIWGIIAIAVIVSIWGLVAILQNAFGTRNTNASNFNSQFNSMIPTVNP